MQISSIQSLPSPTGRGRMKLRPIRSTTDRKETAGRATDRLFILAPTATTALLRLPIERPIVRQWLSTDNTAAESKDGRHSGNLADEDVPARRNLQARTASSGICHYGAYGTHGRKGAARSHRRNILRRTERKRRDTTKHSPCAAIQRIPLQTPTCQRQFELAQSTSPQRAHSPRAKATPHRRPQEERSHLSSAQRARLQAIIGEARRQAKTIRSVNRARFPAACVISGDQLGTLLTAV